MPEQTEPSPPLGEETIGQTVSSATPAEFHVPQPRTIEQEGETTRRFYILLLGLIVVAALVAVVIMSLDDPDSDIAAPIVLGGVAVGALASLATHDRR